MAPSERLSRADLVLPAAVLLLVLAALAGLRAARSGEEGPPSDPTHPDVVPDPPAAPAAACERCHPAEVEAWRGSHHALAQTELGPEHGGPDAPALTYRGRGVPVVGRIGVDPLVQWLVDVGGGRIQVTQQAVHVRTGEVFDVFGDGREAGEWGHWTGGGMTWNRSCASCHATEVRKGFDGTGYGTRFAEAGVGCAACHGDAAAHARGEGAPPLATEAVDACAPCHARRAELTDGYDVGAPFLDAFAPALIDGTPGGLFHGDGQVRDEVFEWAAFASSRMHAAGVTCGDCHEAHSGGLVRDGDALCLGCHEALPGFAAHDLHEVTVGCVGCHMPVTTYMQRHARHDHGFRIPDPVTGEALGIPDACSRCHPERDNVDAFVAEYGPRELDPRARAFVEGDPDALVALVADPSASTLWRASAAARLGQWPEAAAQLVPYLTDPEPLVRFGAWSGYGPWLFAGEPSMVAERVRRGLDDEVRAVRVAAARAGASTLERSDPAVADYRGYLDHNADQPDALVEDASWALSRGDLATAAGRLELALRLDPQRVTALDALSVVRARQGDGEAAVGLLERAVALAPDDGPLWGRLGLARAGTGDTMGAEQALVEAAQRGAPRAAYNLGLLLAERGAYPDALRQLFVAEEQGDGPDVRYAIASTLWRWGRRDEARIAAKRVLQLDPEHAGAHQILAAP